MSAIAIAGSCCPWVVCVTVVVCCVGVLVVAALVVLAIKCGSSCGCGLLAVVVSQVLVHCSSSSGSRCGVDCRDVLLAGGVKE